jgi:hypothetical protein
VRVASAQRACRALDFCSPSLDWSSFRLLDWRFFRLLDWRRRRQFSRAEASLGEF